MGRVILRAIARMVVRVAQRSGVAASNDAVGSRVRVPSGLKRMLARGSVFASTMGGRKSSIVVQSAGCHLWVPTADVSLFWSLLADCYEPQTLQIVKNRMQLDRGEFIDVGGNIGVFSMVAARATTRRVFAFEPDASNAAFLRGNATLNGVAARVLLQECAVGASDGRATLYRAASHGNHSVIAGVVDAPIGEREVPRVRLDSFVAERRRSGDPCVVSLVKIDCEGSELEVLRGASSLLREPGVAWIVEFWEPSFRQRPEDRAEFWDIIFANFAHVLIVDDVAERLIPINAPPLAGSNFYVNLLCLHEGDEAWLLTAGPTYGVSTGSTVPHR